MGVLKDQGRGIAGALLVAGLSVLYTMETWWLAWTLPIQYLIVYALVGLGGVLFVTRNVGFREDEDKKTRNVRQLVTDFSELLIQSFVTAYLFLLILGVLELNDSASTIVRLGLLQVVPLGFGAALANAVLRGGEEESPETVFPKNIGIFALGALFVTFPLVPTEEMEKIAMYMGWNRALLLIVVTVAVSYLVLYELGFRGESSRLEHRSKPYQVGMAFVIYAVALVVSTVMLAAFGHFLDTTAAEAVQQVIVLSFPASVGASAGEVVF